MNFSEFDKLAEVVAAPRHVPAIAPFREKPVDVFTTFQGTGALQGVQQRFMRLKGCAVRCPIRKICDEQGALDFPMTQIDCERLAEDALLAVGPNGWVHITGGEPCDNEQLPDLAREITKRGLRIHLQTSGMRDVPIEWDWLTVSPKCMPSNLVQRRGSEMVLVNMPQIVIDIGILRAFMDSTKFLHYYLQPLWNPDGTSNAVETVQKCETANHVGMSWRLAIQAHKFWGCK